MTSIHPNYTGQALSPYDVAIVWTLRQFHNPFQVSKPPIVILGSPAISVRLQRIHSTDCSAHPEHSSSRYCPLCRMGIYFAGSSPKHAIVTAAGACGNLPQPGMSIDDGWIPSDHLCKRLSGTHDRRHRSMQWWCRWSSGSSRQQSECARRYHCVAYNSVWRSGSSIGGHQCGWPQRMDRRELGGLKVRLLIVFPRFE